MEGIVLLHNGGGVLFLLLAGAGGAVVHFQGVVFTGGTLTGFN